MPTDTLIDHMISQVRNAGYWDNDADAWIDGGCVPTVGTSSTSPSDADFGRIDIFSTDEVVNGAGCVPGFDSRRGISS